MKKLGCHCTSRSSGALGMRRFPGFREIAVRSKSMPRTRPRRVMAWAARWRAALTRGRTSAKSPDLRRRCSHLGREFRWLGQAHLARTRPCTKQRHSLQGAPISVPLSATKQGLQSCEPGRDSENLCPPRSSNWAAGRPAKNADSNIRPGQSQHALNSVLQASAPLHRILSCEPRPRYARSVAFPRLLLLSAPPCNPSAMRSCRTIPSGAFRYQFPAQTSSSRGRSRMLTRSKGRNHNLHVRFWRPGPEIPRIVAPH